MPRVADHDQRRALIARAFQELLAAEGLARTSFVRVAARAGVSVGLIQHYFANRDELLQFAYQDCLLSLRERVDAHIRQGEEAGQPISAMLVSGLSELLPLDAERTVEHRVRQWLVTASLTDTTLAAVARGAATDLHDRAAMAIENGKKCGEVAASVDGSQAASMILATAHGLADALALRAPRARPTLDGVTDVLWPVVSIVFTGRCRHHDVPVQGAAGAPVSSVRPDRSASTP